MTAPNRMSPGVDGVVGATGIEPVTLPSDPITIAGEPVDDGLGHLSERILGDGRTGCPATFQRVPSSRSGRLAPCPAACLAGPGRHGRAGPLARLCQRAGRTAGPRQAGRGSLPRRPADQHGGGSAPPSGAADHLGASRPQARSAVPHPQTAADCSRAADPARTSAAAGWACCR
jgi:hypothetical protein